MSRRNRRPCICGCGVRAIQRHHVIYAQHCRAEKASVNDLRNLVPVAKECHEAHHNRKRPYSLSSMPDSVFEFAAEALGPDRAFNYLRRRYTGPDARLEALIA